MHVYIWHTFSQLAFMYTIFFLQTPSVLRMSFFTVKSSRKEVTNFLNKNKTKNLKIWDEWKWPFFLFIFIVQIYLSNTLLSQHRCGLFKIMSNWDRYIETKKKKAKEKIHHFTAFLTLRYLLPYTFLFEAIKHLFYWVFTSNKLTTEDSLLPQ